MHLDNYFLRIINPNILYYNWNCHQEKKQFQTTGKKNMIKVGKLVTG
jgi:hypothetical protein